MVLSNWVLFNENADKKRVLVCLLFVGKGILFAGVLQSS